MCLFTGTVSNREQQAYEHASVEMSAAHTNLKLDGMSATVDHALTGSLRQALQSFQAAAVVNGVTPSPAFNDKLQRLKHDAALLRNAAHDANYAVYVTTVQQLQAKAIGPVHERVNKKVRTCSNTHRDHTFNLAGMWPQHFGPAARATLYSVRAKFAGSSGGGEGMFNLGPGAGEHLVSTGGIGGKRYNGYRLFYNPQNTVLRVYLEGYGWGGGVCTNPLEMHYVDLTITRNALALPENAAYKLPYSKAEPPVF
jgi:hypothetical protein